MWSEERRNAIWQYLSGKITYAEFIDAIGIKPEAAINEIRRELLDAISSKSMRHVEAAVAVGGIFRLETRSFLDIIRILLNEDWHISHEDLISRLQGLADPSTVEALRSAIQIKPRLDYLFFDDYGAYYKKCLWALRAIGTKEAIALIEECALSDDEALRKEAIYRLSKIKTS